MCCLTHVRHFKLLHEPNLFHGMYAACQGTTIYIMAYFCVGYINATCYSCQGTCSDVEFNLTEVMRYIDVFDKFLFQVFQRVQVGC